MLFKSYRFFHVGFEALGVYGENKKKTPRQLKKVNSLSQDVTKLEILTNPLKHVFNSVANYKVTHLFSNSSSMTSKNWNFDIEPQYLVQPCNDDKDDEQREKETSYAHVRL